MRNLLYIGNKPSKNQGTVTTIETLSLLLASEGFTVTTSSAMKSKPLRLLDMIFSTFRNRKKVSMVLIDTYSTQNFYYAVAVAKVCRLFGLPYIPILHGGDLPSRLKRSPRLSRKLFGNAMVNVAPSQYLMEAFAAEGYNNLTYIPNTIEIANYPFLLRKEIAPKLLWVRSFAAIYNPLLALEVLQELINKGYNATLCMIGPEKDGSLLECKAFSQKNELPVTFTGRLDKAAWIALAKEHSIFVNTTNFDNMPVSVVEAMALGMPVVSTNVGGLPFLIEHTKTGILVAPNDANGFVQAIESLISQPDYAASLSESGRKKAESFDWQKAKHSWLSLLNH